MGYWSKFQAARDLQSYLYKMTCYSVELRDGIFAKGYGFLSFSSNAGTNIGKNISKNLSSKYSKKRFDHAKKSATDAFRTASKRVIQKTAEVSKAKTSKTSPQNYSVTNEDFSHKLLLTDTQVSKIFKFSKTQFPKMIQSGGVMTGISGIDIV